ncbi:MAG: ABC transporter permease subunit [Chthoniobacterales bacterium]|nr:ABC transporter permease subunit [Chthoniobacterales bacterium]
MNFALSSPFETHALHALLAREFRAALINRYFHVFCALALIGGATAVLFSEDTNATGFFILQIALYFVSLFALLTGVSSAQGEREEWPLLFAQPVGRGAFVIGKFCALFLIFGGVLLLLFLPALVTGSAATMLLRLYFQTLLLAAAFVSCGLVAGFLANDRSQALIIGVSAWLFLLFGVDLMALFAARWPLLQSVPDLWVAALMLNPLDAFRIEALFALQQIPAEAANKTPLAAWWIDHAALWFSAIAVMWTLALIAFSAFRLERWEE